jgi:hypothetical protein
MIRSPSSVACAPLNAVFSFVARRVQEGQLQRQDDLEGGRDLEQHAAGNAYR